MTSDKPELIIIGSDGFIGSAIKEYFLQAGWKVHSTVYFKSPAKGEIKLDVTRKEDFKQLPQGIPLINTSGLPDQSASAALMRKVHVGGMKNIIHWARSAGCPHVIQLSSVSVYGNATVGTGRTEAATPRRSRSPLTAPLPYGRSKARAEELLEKSGLPWSAPRLPAVIGPGDSFFSRQLKKLLEDKNRPLPPGGDKPVSIIPVDETGPLLEAILNHGPMNTALNAAAFHLPWKTILEAYAEAWELPLRTAKAGTIRDYINFSNPGRQMAAYYAAYGAEFPDNRIRELLGWQPSENWEKSIRAAAAGVN